jgi:hypothetical protein
MESLMERAPGRGFMLDIEATAKPTVIERSLESALDGLATFAASARWDEVEDLAQLHSWCMGIQQLAGPGLRELASQLKLLVEGLILDECKDRRVAADLVPEVLRTILRPETDPSHIDRMLIRIRSAHSHG